MAFSFQDGCIRLQANYPTLTKVNLSNTNKKTANIIAFSLQKNHTTLPTLKLDLDSNFIGDLGAQAIAAALQINTTLTALYLIQQQYWFCGCKSYWL